MLPLLSACATRAARSAAAPAEPEPSPPAEPAPSSAAAAPPAPAPPAPAPSAPAPSAEQTAASAISQSHEAKRPSSALPPCAPVHKVHHRRKVHPKEPQGPEPPNPPNPVEQVDARVGEVGTSLTSILGKNVEDPKGGALGRVVDVLADPEGHVRVAIIDFGGFLGVGTRRIAVDWPLLHFNPQAHDKSLILSVTRAKLQSAPEYKDSTSPQVLMPPPAEASQNAADTGEAKK